VCRRPPRRCCSCYNAPSSPHRYIIVHCCCPPSSPLHGPSDPPSQRARENGTSPAHREPCSFVYRSPASGDDKNGDTRTREMVRTDTRREQILAVTRIVSISHGRHTRHAVTRLLLSATEPDWDFSPTGVGPIGPARVTPPPSSCARARLH